MPLQPGLTLRQPALMLLIQRVEKIKDRKRVLCRSRQQGQVVCPRMNETLNAFSTKMRASKNAQIKVMNVLTVAGQPLMGQIRRATT